MRSPVRRRASDADLAPTIRCAVLVRCDGLANSSTRATSVTSYPGFLASSAAAISRTRSMIRLRFGEPAAAKLRLRCSRVTFNCAATSSVRTVRPPYATIARQARSWIWLSRPSARYASCKAAPNRVVKLCGKTRSRTTPSSIPSTSTSANSSSTQRASTAVSATRIGLSAQKGTLGWSRASAAAFHVSSVGCATSTIAASTRDFLNAALNSPTVLASASLPRRRGKACLRTSRARARDANASTCGAMGYAMAGEATSGYRPLGGLRAGVACRPRTVGGEQRSRTRQHVAGVRVREQPGGFIVPRPPAGGDPLGTLGLGCGVGRFDQVEVADFVDQPTAKVEVPVDRLDGLAQLEPGEPRLLADLPDGGGCGMLAILEMSLGESPVPVAVPDQQVERLRAFVAKDHPARGGLVARLAGAPLGGPLLSLGHTPAPTGWWCSVARPSMNCRTTGSCVCLISSIVPTWRTFPSYSIAMRVPTM